MDAKREGQNQPATQGSFKNELKALAGIGLIFGGSVATGFGLHYLERGIDSITNGPVPEPAAKIQRHPSPTNGPVALPNLDTLKVRTNR